MKKSYKRSNAVHERLKELNNEIANKTHQSKARHFWSIVKRNYHWDIIVTQEKKKRVLTKEERNEIFKDCEESLAAHRYSVPSLRYFRGWVPKKYRNDRWVRKYYGD